MMHSVRGCGSETEQGLEGAVSGCHQPKQTWQAAEASGQVGDDGQTLEAMTADTRWWTGGGCCS